MNYRLIHWNKQKTSGGLYFVNEDYLFRIALIVGGRWVRHNPTPLLQYSRCPYEYRDISANEAIMILFEAKE